MCQFVCLLQKVVTFSMLKVTTPGHTTVAHVNARNFLSFPFLTL